MRDKNNRSTIHGDAPGVVSLPHIMRIETCQQVQGADSIVNCCATVYHRQRRVTVCWSAHVKDARLRWGVLVTVKGRAVPTEDAGVLHIERLERVTSPDDYSNLFDTVPETWPVGRDLIDRARARIHQLPRRLRQLFNAIFWDGQRFLRYLTGPRSIEHDQPDLNGNFRHGLDLVDRALALAEDDVMVYRGLIILGGVLLNAGKADHYQLHPTENRFVAVASDPQGGPRTTSLEWLSLAKVMYQPTLPLEHYRTLSHMISDTWNSAAGYAVRATLRREVALLAQAESILKSSNMHAQRVGSSV